MNRPGRIGPEPGERELEHRRLGLGRPGLGRGDDGVDEPVEAERRQVIVEADVPVGDDCKPQAGGPEIAQRFGCAGQLLEGDLVD